MEQKPPDVCVQKPWGLNGKRAAKGRDSFVVNTVTRRYGANYHDNRGDLFSESMNALLQQLQLRPHLISA